MRYYYFDETDSEFRRLNEMIQKHPYLFVHNNRVSAFHDMVRERCGRDDWIIENLFNIQRFSDNNINIFLRVLIDQRCVPLSVLFETTISLRVLHSIKEDTEELDDFHPYFETLHAYKDYYGEDLKELHALHATYGSAKNQDE